MNPNIDDIINSTNYPLIYSLLHNYYISKSPEVLELALTKCRDNLLSSYYSYDNFLSGIFINDIVLGLELMDKLNISYDKSSALSSSELYKATKCCKYLKFINLAIN